MSVKAVIGIVLLVIVLGTVIALKLTGRRR